MSQAVALVAIIGLCLAAGYLLTPSDPPDWF